MSTLDEIKKLSDGQFHRLGDDLLRRIDPRYRRLRTHGLNERGESIIGQPDSYVGDTAATCTIAVCYTVQRKGWWTKVVDDVREAVAASPLVEEIVVVIPHNADRDGPKDKSIDWLEDSRKEAGKAGVRVIDGRDIIHRLDTEHQDLRHEHLGIAYSRLSGPSILVSCRHATQEVIESIQASGRYDPERYAPRNADGELHRLWQVAYRPGSDDGRSTNRVRFIALVNDSGMGKTSLVCEFSRTMAKVLPVLLIQASDLTFDTETGLVAHVIHMAQGVLDQPTRVLEEAALTKHLAGSMPLTIVLDGLDETRNPEAIRKAISYWLKSKLGRSSILIATSRREFWRTCADPSWKRWMSSTVPDDRSPIRVFERSHLERLDPAEGIRLPRRFSQAELEVAWLRAGQPRRELFDFPAEVREEFRHPFTLRAFLDLRSQEWQPPRSLTRASILEQWLKHRLDAEENPRERITRSHFQQALRLVASRLDATNAGHLAVDDLDGLPRFDPTHPPGPVVQRLIEANILEGLPGQPDKIRFSIAAVQDFYQAEADLEEIKCDPEGMAQKYSRLTFTAAYPRLARLGLRLVGEAVRDVFARSLAELDARMTAIVLRAAPHCFSPDIRAHTALELGNQLSSRHRVRAALAINLLGELNCSESIDVLTARLLPPADIHPYLKALGASAFVKLGYVPAASFVYRWKRFGVRANGEHRFYGETLAILRSSHAEFRNALADEAMRRLSTSTGTRQTEKAVTVLAYLGDHRLVEHLDARLAQNGSLNRHENYSLIVIGDEPASDLFARSLLSVGRRLEKLPNDSVHHEARHKIIREITFPFYEIRYFISEAFKPHLKRLIEDENADVSWIAGDLAKRGRQSTLLLSVALAGARRRGWQFAFDQGERDCITAELWLAWWRHSTDISARRSMMALMPTYPNGEVEAVLVDSLDSPELRGLAARGLGQYGAVRSAALLRVILEEDIDGGNKWDEYAVAHALGDLRDEVAVPLLERVATEHADLDVVREAVTSLGLIGDLEVERALERLLQRDGMGDDEEAVLEALLMCGSERAVSLVVGRARCKADGLIWLCERIHNLGSARGWRRGEYYTHIHTDELVHYLDSQELPGQPEQLRRIVEAFEQIDSPPVRELLKKWAGIRGPAQKILSQEECRPMPKDLCFWQLRDRGDESAIEYALDERFGDREPLRYSLLTSEDLRSFPAASVAERLRTRLASETTVSEIARLLSFLGHFGAATDADLARRFLDHLDDLVANVACESMLRLSDPLLVPDRWREL